MIMAADRSGMCRSGQQAGDPGKNGCCSLESEVSLEAEFFFLRDPSFLLRPSTNWLKPTHIREGDLVYPV